MHQTHSSHTSHSKRRSNCRLCEQSGLDLVLPLEKTAPADAFVSKDNLGELQETYPLDLFLCRSCGHAQLLDVVDPDILFGKYTYETKNSPGLIEHFRNYADDITRLANLSEGSFAVDIGSNDGTLLRFLQEKGLRVLGVDAAVEIAKKATESGIETIGGYFTSQLAHQLREQRGAAHLITANNVFAHADELADIAEGIRILLASDGVFVFEVSYLADLVYGKVFDYIYHEHLCYHSVRPLQLFLAKHGLELIDVMQIGTKGGSLRCIAQIAKGPREISPHVEALIQQEAKQGLQSPEVFKDLANQLDSIKNELHVLLEELKSKGKKVAGYGASATVTTLLYHFDLAQYIDFVVDDNIVKQGLYTPGHHIPVFSSEALYEKKPDCVVILAWRFADLILKRHQKFLEKGGQFIVPLPKIQIML